MALPEHLADLERKVSARFSEALAKIRLEMRRTVASRSAAGELPPCLRSWTRSPLPATSRLLAEEDLLGDDPRGGWRGAPRSRARAARAPWSTSTAPRPRTPSSKLSSRGARKFGDHAALWLMRPETIVGWASRGFDGDPVAGSTLPHDTSPGAHPPRAGRGCVLLARDGGRATRQRARDRRSGARPLAPAGSARPDRGGALPRLGSCRGVRGRGTADADPRRGATARAPGAGDPHLHSDAVSRSRRSRERTRSCTLGPLRSRRWRFRS